MAKRRRRHPRPIQPEVDTQPDPMDLIREQADEPTPARMSDEEVEAEALAQEDVADEIADGMAEVDADAVDEDGTLRGLEPGHVPSWISDGGEYDVEVTAGSAAPDEMTEMQAERNEGVTEVADDASPYWQGNVEEEPPFDPEIFERGPLAAGIRMLEALLTEARSGYITAQIDELARVLDIDPSPDERFFLARVSAGERTASGLPDVAGAYQALVSAKARVQG